MKRLLLIVLVIFALSEVSLDAQVIVAGKWKYEMKQTSEKTAELYFTVKIIDLWHIYAPSTPDGGPLKMEFTFNKSPNYDLIGNIVEVTQPIVEHDDVFDIDVRFFKKQATFKQKIKIKSDKAFKLEGTVDYQACIEEKCVPEGNDFSFEINSGKTSVGENKTQTNNNIAQTTTVKSEIKTDTSYTAKATIDSTKKEEKISSSDITGDDKSLIIFFWFSFLAGLLAIFTPCVFPMIPMTVSYFLHEENKAKGRFQAMIYGFSIILIYTIIGTIVAITLGANFANWLSTHWIPNVLFFLIFVVFAASFFGMFEITLPSWMINKSVEKEDKGGITGAFFMAFTLVLVSFSCTGPLVGAILVKSAGGEILEPIIGMFGFSLAFALPFTLFALFPAWLKNMPKSGGWLNSVKVVLGFIELALGLKFLSVADQTYHWGILDREIYIAFWIIIFTLLGFYLLGKIKFAHDSEVKHISVPRLLLVIITFTFVIYLVPGMFGAPLKALSGYLPPMHSHDFDIEKIVRENVEANSISNAGNEICEKARYSDFLHLPHGLKGYFDYDQALSCAKNLNKPVFIDFTGHGCVNCREMEANVWSDPRVLKILREDYVVVALYVDDKTELPEKEWITSKYDGKVKKSIGKKYADYQISRFNVNAQPYYVLLDYDGNQLVNPRAYNLNVDEFVNFLNNGLTKFKNRSNDKL